MESNGEFFGWNQLKIDQEDNKTSRKRKLSEERTQSSFKLQKDPLSLDEKKGIIQKKAAVQKGKIMVSIMLFS